jgi:hypothetical protein
MYVEFEEVEEGIGYEVECAVYVFFDAEEKLQRLAGLVTDGEGYVLELTAGVGDLDCF